MLRSVDLAQLAFARRSEVGSVSAPMRARDFPSYRLRHRIRMWRYRRRYPWHFTDAQEAQQIRGDVVHLPPSEETDRVSPDDPR